jgi:CheY-like chemotaxis protein
MGRVLIVEDDPHSARMLRALLKNGGGHDVLVTLDPAEILRRCQAGELDLALLDVSIGGCMLEGRPLDGVALCQLIKEHSHDRPIPVVLVTAHAMRGDRERLVTESGADGYVSKPIEDHEAMLRVVSNYLQAGANGIASKQTEGRAACA